MSRISLALSRPSVQQGKLVSSDEKELDLMVEDLLYEANVLGIGGTMYGLKWRHGTADDPKFVTGGWLFQASKDMIAKKKSKGKLCFYTLDDTNKMLRQCKDESVTYTYKSLEYKLIRDVRPCKSPQGAVYIRVYASKGKDWTMMPIQDTNDEIVIRWVAALRHRANLLSSKMQREVEAANRLALWIQSLVRMRKAIEKLERMRERRRGLVNTLNGMWYGYDDTDEEAENSSEEEEDTESGVSGDNFLSTFVSALVADMYEKTLGTGDMDASPVPQLPQQKRTSLFKRKSLFKPKMGMVEQSSPSDEDIKRSESFVQDNFTHTPLRHFEIEDELWENQRWQLKSGWSTRSLLPTDRSAFTDRIGRGKWESLNQVPIPDGWKIVSDWELDLSGQVNGLCGTDGYTYSIDFPPLDSDLAKGTPRITRGVRSVVRHRRFFRRRVPIRTPRADSFVIWHGWLGWKSHGSGRWHNRYFVLTRGLRLHGRVTGVALSFFRSEFMDHLQVIASNDLEAWNALTTRQLKTFNLDGALVLEPKIAPGKRSFNFEVRVASRLHPSLLLNADSSLSKENWVAAINHAVKDQLNRFTLTKSLDLGKAIPFANIPHYENAILDRLLPMKVDGAYKLLFFDKSFEDEFLKICQFKVEEKEEWSNGKNKGSRKKQVLMNKKRMHTIFKQKIVRCEKGQGYQVDMTMQSPQSAWGNIYQDEIRLILSNWKEKYTRLCVTHRVHLRSEDDSVKAFVESNARRQVLELFSEKWLPLVTRSLKAKRKRDEEKTQQMTLSSPTGISYRFDTSVQQIRADGYHY